MRNDKFSNEIDLELKKLVECDDDSGSRRKNDIPEPKQNGTERNKKLSHLPESKLSSGIAFIIVGILFISCVLYVTEPHNELMLLIIGVAAIVLGVFTIAKAKPSHTDNLRELQQSYREMLTQHIKFQEETSGDDEKYLYNKDEKTYPKYYHQNYPAQGYVAQRKYSLEEHFYDNWSELLAYYEISKQQAVESFDWAIRFSVIGILIIVFAIASPCVLILPTEYSLVPVIGSIAGAVVEVFAGTILVVYIKSLSQMSIYHTALADYQRYLSCACLVGNLTEEKRDEMYAEIIRGEMKKTTFVEVQSKKKGLFGKKSTN